MLLFFVGGASENAHRTKKKVCCIPYKVSPLLKSTVYFTIVVRKNTDMLLFGQDEKLG